MRVSKIFAASTLEAIASPGPFAFRISQQFKARPSGARARIMALTAFYVCHIPFRLAINFKRAASGIYDAHVFDFSQRRGMTSRFSRNSRISMAGRYFAATMPRFDFDARISLRPRYRPLAAESISIATLAFISAHCRKYTNAGTRRTQNGEFILPLRATANEYHTIKYRHHTKMRRRQIR